MRARGGMRSLHRRGEFLEGLMIAVGESFSDDNAELSCSLPVIDRQCRYCCMMILCLDEESHRGF